MNEVGSGLMIVDELQGVPINISAELIMELVRVLHSHSTLFVVTNLLATSSLDSTPAVTIGMYWSCSRSLLDLVSC